MSLTELTCDFTEIHKISRKIRMLTDDSGSTGVVIVCLLFADSRDLKIRRQRVSAMATVSWGEWGEVAVVWREKLTLRSTVEEVDGIMTSFRGLSVF